MKRAMGRVLTCIIKYIVAAPSGPPGHLVSKGLTTGFLGAAEASIPTECFPCCRSRKSGILRGTVEEIGRWSASWVDMSGYPPSELTEQALLVALRRSAHPSSGVGDSLAWTAIATSCFLTRAEEPAFELQKANVHSFTFTGSSSAIDSISSRAIKSVRLCINRRRSWN